MNVRLSDRLSIPVRVQHLIHILRGQALLDNIGSRLDLARLEEPREVLPEAHREIRVHLRAAVRVAHLEPGRLAHDLALVHGAERQQPRESTLLGARQRVERQHLVLDGAHGVVGVDEVISDDIPDAREHGVLPAVPVEDVRRPEALELGLIPSNNHDPPDPRELGQLDAEPPAVGPAADDQERRPRVVEPLSLGGPRRRDLEDLEEGDQGRDNVGGQRGGLVVGRSRGDLGEGADVCYCVLLEPVLCGCRREARLAYHPVADRDAAHVLADLCHRAHDVCYVLATCHEA